MPSERYKWLRLILLIILVAYVLWWIFGFAMITYYFKNVSVNLPAAYGDIVRHRVFVDVLTVKSDSQLLELDPETLERLFLEIEREVEREVAGARAGSIDMSTSKFYMLVGAKAGCHKVSEFIDGYNAADSPALKLAKYFALVNCCDFVDLPADFLQKALEDSACEHLVKCEFVSMTKSHVNDLVIQPSDEIRLAKLAESLRNFGATCDPNEEISAVCEEIADTLLE